jgi:hypothetical protein
LSPTDSSQLKILAFRTIPYGLLAVLCSTLTYVGITPVRGAESIPLLHALSSPFSIVLWIAATLTFAALFAVSAVKQHRLLDLEARRDSRVCATTGGGSSGSWPGKGSSSAGRRPRRAGRAGCATSDARADGRSTNWQSC